MNSQAETGFRIALALLCVAAAAIGIPHRLRADRVGGKVSRRGDPSWFWILMTLVGLPLAATCLGFVVQPRRVEFALVPLPLWLRLAGVPLGLAGLALLAWMFRYLGLNVTSTSIPREGATLVTTGPYRWTRHPMYTATLVLGAAATLLTANAIVGVGSLAMFVLLAARAPIEERRLAEKFGGAYEAYRAKTGRFFPRIRQ